jgi:hypothetical protein
VPETLHREQSLIGGNCLVYLGLQPAEELLDADDVVVVHVAHHDEVDRELIEVAVVKYLFQARLQVRFPDGARAAVDHGELRLS